MRQDETEGQDQKNMRPVKHPSAFESFVECFFMSKRFLYDKKVFFYTEHTE
jgi:hypothetical protein